MQNESYEFEISTYNTHCSRGPTKVFALSQINVPGSHLVFQNEAKNIPRQDFMVMYISWKFEKARYNIFFFFVRAVTANNIQLYIPAIGWSNFLYMRTGPKCEKMAKIWPLRGHQWPWNWRSRSQNNSMALSIYTHIPNLTGLTKLFFKLSRPKGNLCGGGVTVLNPKYPRLSSGDKIKV